MTSPADPVSEVLISGPAEVVSALATNDDVDLVRGSVIQQDDQTRSVVGYATDAAIASLQSLGLDVTSLADPADLQERWETAQSQAE